MRLCLPEDLKPAIVCYVRLLCFRNFSFGGPLGCQVKQQLAAPLRPGLSPYFVEFQCWSRTLALDGVKFCFLTCMP